MDLLLTTIEEVKKDSVCLNDTQTSYFCYYNACEASFRGSKYLSIGHSRAVITISTLPVMSLTLPQLSQHSI